MIKSYFTTAIKALGKNKVFTAINVMGLAIGISASLVIYLIVNYHFSFDKFEKDRDRVYRVVSNFEFSGEVYKNSGVCDPMERAVKKEVTGVEAVIPFRTWNMPAKIMVPENNGQYKLITKNQEHIVFAGKSYFDMVPYEWVAGNSASSLEQPNQVVLTESLATIFFPGTAMNNVVGKRFTLNDTVSLQVSGIVKNQQRNTDFNFTSFISYATLEKTTLKPDGWDQWNNTNGVQQLYIKLSPGAQPAQIQKQIAKIYDLNNKKEADDHSKTWHTLQPLSDLHFNADYGIYDSAVAHKPTLYSLLAVAAFLLLLGCINFINLTTAHAAKRAKEIGIRKTMGSSKKQLVFQFLAETFLLTLIATLVSIALTPLLLKAFDGFIPKELHFNLIDQPGIVVFLLLLLLVVTLLSGFYPAMVLSSFKPVLVLKNQAYGGTGQTRNAWLRKSLTISQFVIAQTFIMGAILVSKQISFFLNKDLGFKKDALVYVQTNFFDTSKTNKPFFVEQLKGIPEIASISLSSATPSSNNTWSSSMKFKDGKREVETDVQLKFADTGYVNIYKLKLLAGNNYINSDTVNSFLINETYARILGYQNPKAIIGKTLEWNNKQVPITGVVADFHQKSLREQIKPVAIGNWASQQRTITMALQPQNAEGTVWPAALKKIEKAWKQVYINDDFDYKFFDKEIEQYYKEEQNISSLLKWATGLAIFISCLGLLGLVIYTTNQRTKEIGVRKVLGASVPQIFQMIAKDFVLLVLIAFMIAAPLAWIGMHKWLEGFAYRTSITWWVFFSAGFAMVIIALVTLAFQTIKAAVANPVKSLRTE